MKKIVLLLIICAPLLSMAQQPKMDIRLYGGMNVNNFIYRSETLDPDFLTGWQVGGGFRVSHRKMMLEVDLTYVNSGLTVGVDEDSDIIIEEPIDITMHSLEIPLTAGYIPVKTPVFKWYLYGGLVSKFRLKGKYTYQGETGSFKPDELNLHWYNLGARIGTQFDITFFNFDLNYTMGITNGTKGKVRTNTHGVQLSAGFVF